MSEKGTKNKENTDPARLKYEGWNIGSGLPRVKEGTSKSGKEEKKTQEGRDRTKGGVRFFLNITSSRKK